MTSTDCIAVICFQQQHPYVQSERNQSSFELHEVMQGCCLSPYLVIPGTDGYACYRLDRLLLNRVHWQVCVKFVKIKGTGDSHIMQQKALSAQVVDHVVKSSHLGL